MIWSWQHLNLGSSSVCYLCMCQHQPRAPLFIESEVSSEQLKVCILEAADGLVPLSSLPPGCIWRAGSFHSTNLQLFTSFPLSLKSSKPQCNVYANHRQLEHWATILHLRRSILLCKH
jgi:hypothetical protein